MEKFALESSSMMIHLIELFIFSNNRLRIGYLPNISRTGSKVFNLKSPPQQNLACSSPFLKTTFTIMEHNCNLPVILLS